MPLSIVPVTNPHLAAPPHDFRSVSERKDLPRKTLCQPDEGNGIYCTNPLCWCQQGCDNSEVPFAYIVDEGDTIFLQFHAIDYANVDPGVPVNGWREDQPLWFIGLEVYALDGTLLWDGDTRDISNGHYVGTGPYGSYQNIAVDVDKLVQAVESGSPPIDMPDCWYFRLAINSYLPDVTVINHQEQPTGLLKPGTTYLDFDTDMVMTWSGFAWVPSAPTEGEFYYVFDSGNWYTYTGGAFVAATPEIAEENASTERLTTMTYRFRKCNECVVHIQGELKGQDCNAFIHDLPPIEYLMEPIEGVMFVSYFSGGGGENPLDFYGGHDPAWDTMPLGTTMVSNGSNLLYTMTLDGWVQEELPEGTVVLIMNSGAPGPYGSGYHWNTDTSQYETIVAGTVLTLVPYIPLIGPWHTEGLVGDVYPGTEFVEGIQEQRAFTYDFKVLGCLEAVEMPLLRETTEKGRMISVDSQTRARMRLSGMPEQVARMVQAALTSVEPKVDGLIWDEFEGPKKNNDEGSHWWLDMLLLRTDCSVDVPC